MHYFVNEKKEDVGLFIDEKCFETRTDADTVAVHSVQ